MKKGGRKVKTQSHPLFNWQNALSLLFAVGVTFASGRRWQEANDTLEKALAMQKTWVTDDYYRGIARQTLKRVKAHLK